MAKLKHWHLPKLKLGRRPSETGPSRKIANGLRKIGTSLKDFAKAANRRGRRFFAKHTPAYWVTAVLVLFVSVASSSYLDEQTGSRRPPGCARP
jgi:hypothetical protein